MGWIFTKAVLVLTAFGASGHGIYSLASGRHPNMVLTQFFATLALSLIAAVLLEIGMNATGRLQKRRMFQSDAGDR